MKKLLCLIILISGVFLPLAAAPAIRQKKIDGRTYFNVQDLLKGNRFSVSSRSGWVNGVKAGQRLAFASKQRRYELNGRRVELSFPMRDIGGAQWMTVFDWQKNLRPLVYPATVPRHRVVTVFLDMGHGGKDPGAEGAVSKEKNLTLAIGRRVAALLRANGFNVKMSRNRDVQIPLKNIGAMQKRSRSDLFVSIHINSAKNRTLTGVETFCLTPAGAASSNGGKADRTVYSGNRFDANNMLLAWHIQQNVLQRTGAVDRGVKRARFAVLKDINAPGVLVEVGFISNRAEERKLNSRAYQEEIARGIVSGIITYRRALNVKKP